jgi:acyl carrier protein
MGVPGELWIAGDSLAQGYHNQPALTAERFVDSPFRPGERCCRTGDMARWLPDGKIEYLGRVDGQVKPHGYRINLAEIETQLEGHPTIRGAVVISHTSQGRSQLIGFYIRQEKGGQRIESRSLRDYLASRLPDYMVPSKFIEVRDIPLTPNGKVDRKRLARLAMSPIRSTPDASPEVDAWIERRVAAIWQSVLGRDDLDVNEGFFDAGGDSSLAVVIAERIKEEFNSDFNFKSLFQYSSIKESSRYIAGSISSNARPTVPK